MISLLNLAIMAGCGSEHPQNKPVEQAAPVKVRVAPVSQGDRAQVQRLPGTVRAVRSAPIASKLTGTILEVRVRPGDRVKAGQVLAVIDFLTYIATVNANNRPRSRQYLDGVSEATQMAQPAPLSSGLILP